MLIDDGLVVRTDERWRVTGDMTASTSRPRSKRCSPRALTVSRPRSARCSRPRPSSVRTSSSARSGISCPRTRVSACRRTCWRSAEGADPRGTLDASRRGRVPIPPSADPRLRVRRDPEGPTRRAARARRGMARAGGGRSGRRAGRDRRLSPGAGTRVHDATRTRPTSARSDRTAGGRPTGFGGAASDGPWRLRRRRESPAASVVAVGSSDDAERAATLYHLGMALEEIDDIPGRWQRSTRRSGSRRLRRSIARVARPYRPLRACRRGPIPTARPPRSSARSSRRRSARSMSSGTRRAWRRRGRSSRSSTSGRAGTTTPSARPAEPCSTRVGAATTTPRRGAPSLLVVADASVPPRRRKDIATLDELTEDIARSARWRRRPSLSAGRTSSAGLVRRARRLIGLAIEIAEALGVAGRWSRCTRRSSVTWRWGPRPDRRRTSLPAGLRDRRRDRPGGVQVHGRGGPGPGALRARAFRRGRRYATIARSLAAEDDLWPQVVGRSAQAIVLAARGGFDEAERLAREAVRMLEEAESPAAKANQDGPGPGPSDGREGRGGRASRPRSARVLRAQGEPTFVGRDPRVPGGTGRLSVLRARPPPNRSCCGRCVDPGSATSPPPPHRARRRSTHRHTPARRPPRTGRSRRSP